ncbi:MAG: ParB/RepB/Spo0J family partition protein [Candidatus Margulisbacteria bacterium]|nr:ParB/RepB/Spo0J family partition protein [Candidatus Margulisiibacteriota bacterium]
MNYSSPQVRKDLLAGLEELKASIEAEGILFPLIVRKMGREFVVIDGNRRLMALDELGTKPAAKVPVLVVDVHKDKEALRLEMVANLVRSNFAPIEEAVRIEVNFNPDAKLSAVFSAIQKKIDKIFWFVPGTLQGEL